MPLLTLSEMPPAAADFSSEGVVTGVVAPERSASSALIVDVEVVRPRELFKGPRWVSLNSVDG